MKVVTSGSAYLDIDAYAGCIAYSELLNLQGTEAVATSSAPLNESITQSMRMLGKSLVEYTASNTDTFALIDVSTPDFFDPIVKNGDVVEVIDHHPGYEEYWNDKIGNRAQIEPIGAASTQVYEQWQQAGKLDHMDPATATLLAAGILDNTLNFTAGITKNRDRQAFEELARIASLTEDFARQYFSECQTSIEAELEHAIKNDMKHNTDITNLPEFIGQIVVWDGNKILRDDKSTIAEVMGNFGDDWGMNLISISDARSYFLADNNIPQRKLTDLFGVEFNNGISNPYKMMLRKEILKAALDAAN